jgi:hypothetical protein
MAKSPQDARATMVVNLQTLTGRALPAWTRLARKDGPESHAKLVAWLKAEHDLTHGYANLVAHETLRSDAAAEAADGVDLVAAMFAGTKAGTRPIYDALIRAIRGFGADVTLDPKKGYVSVRRTKQFATLHASTATRFDVGLKLRNTAATARLEPAGSWNAMVTHRVRVSAPAEVDRELLAWLRAAYEQG